MPDGEVLPRFNATTSSTSMGCSMFKMLKLKHWSDFSSNQQATELQQEIRSFLADDHLPIEVLLC